jgi:O-antigen/teichoic acid export membrane protein
VDLCGPELIMGLLGGKYLLPKPTMLLVVGSIFLGSVTMYVQKGLEVTGRTLQMSKLALVAAIISLFGNVVLIPNYGVRGAAMMVVVVQLLYLTFVWYATKGTLRATIPIRFVGKLALWAIGVELVCRLLEGVSGPLGSFLGSRFVRVIVLVGATCALYAANDRVSSVGKAIIRAFKRAKQ